MDSKQSAPLIESEALQPTNSGDAEFQFVINDDQRNPSNTRTIRSHVMRQSWRQRKKQQAPGNVIRGTGILAPKVIHTTGRIKAGGVQTGEKYSTPSEADPVPRVYVLMQPSPDVSANKDWGSAFNDTPSSDANDIESLLAATGESNALATNMCRENQDRNSDTRCSGTPTNSSPWSVLASTMMMDTFATFPVEFLPEHQELVHYWLGQYPRTMYGRFRFEDHQHTSLWLPLDFSNEASFHTILAYAALHQAVLRGEAATPRAIMHKTKAIQIINQWLQDPARATSDATIAAVLRQIIIESFGGNYETVNVHREGLKRLIQLRGGLLSLGNNWRLQEAIHVVLLTTMPQWDKPERKRPLLFSVSHDGYSEPNGLRETYKLCEDFVGFFYDIKELTTLAPGICVSSCGRHYVFVETALHRLKHFSRHMGIQITSHSIIEECARLVSIFHLAVLWRDCVNYPNSNTDFIEEVDTILKRSEELCQKSIENIMYCIIAHPQRGLYSTKRSGLVVRLMSIARLLSLPAWQKVKETMLHMLAGITIQELDGLCWNADLLFTEIKDSDRSIALPSIDD